jgi:hypothetical protein
MLMALSANRVHSLEDEAIAVEAARQGLVAYLQLHGAAAASMVLSTVEAENHIDNMTVRRAFWQLLSEGAVKLDGEYQLRLERFGSAPDIAPAHDDEAGLIS